METNLTVTNLKTPPDDDLKLKSSQSHESSEGGGLCSSTDCRICFCAESPVLNAAYPPSYRMVLLKNPCACKGSLARVHEACLAKWLQSRNIRKCELCQTAFVIKEEYGTPIEIARQSLSYIANSKRRLLKVVIYAVYLYLFFKRFAFSLKYFKGLAK